jgi:hypothetical protein
MLDVPLAGRRQQSEKLGEEELAADPQLLMASLKISTRTDHY